MPNDSEKYIEQIACGYDAIADAYFDNYRIDIPSQVTKFVDGFNSQLSPGGTVLEPGCGNGFPFTAQLTKRHRVTGIDVSTAQIEKARAEVRL